MAMNPAAKDSNAFASSNLSGGSANNAILGVPQNPSIPRGPQPTSAGLTPLAQQNNQAMGPQFWNTVSPGTPGPTADAPPDYAAQIAQHNAQMLQQMQAQYGQQPVTPSTQPTYGIGPNNELQVGDTVVPMGDNPTMAANLLQTNGHESVSPTNLKPGFRMVNASDVQQYLSGINRGAGHAAYETGKQFLGGVAGGGLDTLGKAATWAGAPGIGQSLQNAGGAADRFLGTDQPADTLGHGTIASGFINNARSAGLAVPIAAANVGLTAAGMPEVAAAMDVGVVAPLFGASDAQNTYESLIKQGIPQDQANQAGWRQFFISGGTQAALGFAGGRIMANGGAYAGIQRLRQAVSGGELTADQAAQMVTNPQFMKRFATNEAVNQGTQAVGMGAQGALSAANSNAAGGTHEDVGDAALGGAASGLYMGAMMAPIAGYHQFGDSARRAQMGRDLSDPTQPVDLLRATQMENAAKSIQPEVGALVGAAPAQKWMEGQQVRSDKLLGDANQQRFLAQRAAETAPLPAVETPPSPPPVAPVLTPEQELSGLKLSDTLKAIGIGKKKQASVRPLAEQAVAAGIDLESAEAETLVKALKAGKLGAAQLEIDRLKGSNDGTSGLAAAGNAGVGGAGGNKPAGSVGAGVPVAGESGGVRAGTGEPAPSVQPPVVGGNAGVPKAPVASRTATGHENTGKLAPVETKPAPVPALPVNPVKANPWEGMKRTTRGEIEHVPTSSLEGVAGRNKVDTSTPAYAALKEHIAKNGIMDPIVLTRDSSGQPEVFEGNHRLQIARELDLENVPVVLHDRVNHSESRPVAGVKPSSLLVSKTERPAFDLAHPSGAPHSAWHLPEEPAAPEETDNMRPNLGKETGQKHLFPMGARGELPKTGEAPKRVVKSEELAPAQAAVNQGVPIEQVGEHAPPVRETAEDAKKSRKRQEDETAVEAAKTPEQRAAEAEQTAAETTKIPPVERFIAALGELAGTRLHAAANGENWEAMATREGVHHTTPQKYIKNIKPERIDAAMNAGKITPDEARAMKEALDIAQGNAVQRKTEAAVAKDGGASAAFDDNLSAGEKQELMAGGGMQVHGADNMGVKTKAEAEAESQQSKAIAADATTAEKNDAEEQAKEKGRAETRGVDIHSTDLEILKEGSRLEMERNKAQKAGNTKLFDELTDQIRALERVYKKRLDESVKKDADKDQKEKEASDEVSIDDQIEALNDKINDAEEAGNAKQVAKLEVERQALYDKRDGLDAPDDGEAPVRDDKLAGNSDDVEYGKNADGSVKDAYTSGKDLHDELAGWMGASKLPRHIKIVDTASDLTDLQHLGYAFSEGSPFGWAKDGRVVLIADRIRKGDGKGAFLHEVGVHLGLERILGAEKIDAIHAAIKEWAAKDDGSIESKVAKAALLRVEAAKTEGKQKASETVAYFVQEALAHGVEPTALKGYDGRFANFVRQIYAAFKGAIRRVLRGGDITTMSAEDMVNMAYGAARLETAGTYHGAAATFRRFNHEFMGTGEGAQAYGWGTYLAQRFGVAKGYHEADIARKAGAQFEGKSIQKAIEESRAAAKDAKEGSPELARLDALLFVKDELSAGEDAWYFARRNFLEKQRQFPEDAERAQAAIDWMDTHAASFSMNAPKGNLYRVDHAVPESHLLDWDSEQQSPYVAAALDKLWEEASPDWDKIAGLNLDDVGYFSGKQLVRRVLPELRAAGSKIFDKVDPTGDMATHEAVSKLLDSYGIGGSKHLDRPSRGNHGILATRLKELAAARIRYQQTIADLQKEINQNRGRDGILPQFFKRREQDIAEGQRAIVALDADVAHIKSQMGDEPEQTHNHVIFNDKNIMRVASHEGGDTSQVKFGKSVEANIHKLPDHLQEPARTITDRLNRWAGDALNHVVFTRDLVARGVTKGLTALEHYDTLREARDALAGHFQKMAFNAIEPVRKFTQEEKTNLSAFLQHSTLNGEWGYGPKANGKAKMMFDQLSDRAQSVAKAMFAHGDEILKEKKAVIEKKAAELYDDMLKGTTGAEREEILAEKNGFMKKYNTLMQIGEGKPYVPARRHGDWVVVGKSDAYLRAEERASRDGATREDKKALYDLVTDPQHYLVSEAQSEQESKALRQNMRDAGFPATGDHTYYKPKEDWQTELNGGKGVLAGMSRLRHQLEKLSQEAPSEADRLKYKTSARLLTNMWLDALSQSSSRKAEMRRMGVHGTMDMVGSFKQQAKGDAHFISGITHNDAMLTQLKKAYKQADSGEGEDRTTKMNIYNEFMLRHEQSVNAVPTPWANKITKATALWQIATSPAHFIGNLMQPWTMTLPYLQAHHGYRQATSEFFKAYKEIGDILGKTGLLDTLKVSDMPADVRAPMQRLLELGRLDIGMNTEYGSMELRPKNMATRAAQAAADRIAQASLKMESLNRLASAAAAYRLEFAKHGDAERALHYAADVVAETHGDHSRANAPRAFNNGFGKVALQFRKFQLVQLTQMVKMMGNLKNADPAERSIAVRHLVYTLAHVGVLGGALGMPGFSTFSAASQTLQKWLTGVDGEDWETKIEKAVGDRHIAQLLLRGVPGLLGVDLSKKVGYGDMLGIAPYTDVDPTDRKSVQDAIGQVTAGPFGGLVGRAAQSLHHIFVGNYYKGLEGLMPQGIANIMKGAREGGFAPTLGGVTNTKNDKLMDINAGEALLEAFGFEPSSKAMMQSETGAMIKSTEDFKNRLEILKERYNNDARSGSAGTSTAIKEMNDLRKEMVERGYRPTPLADILKTPIEQLKRQMFTTPGGVQYQPKQTGRAIDQLPK